MRSGRIWLVEEDPALRRALEASLVADGHRVQPVEAGRLPDGPPPDLVLLGPGAPWGAESALGARGPQLAAVPALALAPEDARDGARLSRLVRRALEARAPQPAEVAIGNLAALA